MIAEPFALVLALARALDVRAICELPGCWEHQVDETWWFAVNGHDEPRKVKPPDSGDVEHEVPPYHCLVTFNGWPAGLFGPAGGTIAAGDAANEFAFSQAMRAAIRERLPPDVCMHCGCTEDEACEGGCTWAERNLCTACVPPEVRHV